MLQPNLHREHSSFPSSWQSCPYTWSHPLPGAGLKPDGTNTAIAKNNKNKNKNLPPVWTEISNQILVQSWCCYRSTDCTKCPRWGPNPHSHRGNSAHHRLTAGLCSATSKVTHRPLHDNKQQSELFSQQKKTHHIAELLVNLTVLEKKMDNMTACLSAASWMSLFCDNTIRNLCRCSHCSSVLVALGTIILNLYAKVFWDHLWEYHFAQ